MKSLRSLCSGNHDLSGGDVEYRETGAFVLQDIDGRGLNLPADAKIDRQLRRDFPVVLEERARGAPAMLIMRIADLALGLRRIAEQQIRESVTGITIVEREAAVRR